MQESNGRKVALLGVLTGSRLTLAVGVAALTPWSGTSVPAVIASLLLLGLVELTDLFDGHLARRHNAVSDFGKMFDPYCDSVSRLIIYWALAIIGACWAVVPLVMAVRDVTVSYARIVMTRKGIDVSARLSGKVKAIVQGVCAFLLMAACPAWTGQAARGTGVIYWAGSLVVLGVTLWSMGDYVLSALGASDASDGAGPAADGGRSSSGSTGS